MSDCRLYLADQSDGAVVSDVKGQELAEVGTCGDQKGGGGALLRPTVSGFIPKSLMHLQDALTKCGYYICDAARFFRRSKLPPLLPQVLLTCFPEAEKWIVKFWWVSFVPHPP